MALRGNLRDFSLPDVFQLVTFSRKTGVLRIEREDGARGSVWFRDGDVFFASSNWHSEPLGERLVSAHRITPQALKRALESRAAEPETGRRLGQILIDDGYITDAVLETFVSEQIQDTIFDLMRWEEGDFDFEAMPEVVEEDIGLTVSIENVVMEGSRRLEEWGRIKKKIPSTDVVFKMATAPGEGTFEISLKPMEWQLLLLIDGTRSVAELARSTGRTDFEVARIIYGLFSAGLLEFATEEEITRNRAERAEREAKLEKIESARREAEEAEQRQAQEREAKLAEDAARRRAEAERSAAPVAPVAEVPSAPAEEPEFLGHGIAAPSAEDQAVLEQFMGAVLEAPGVPASYEPPAVESPAAKQPYVPVEEPAFMSIGRAEEAEAELVPVPSVEELLPGFTPQPEPASAELDAVVASFEDEETPQPEIVQPENVPALDVDFERDLLALGLGEMPADLLQPVTAEPAPEPAAAEQEMPEPREPMSEAPAAPWVEEAAETPAVESEQFGLSELEALSADLGLPSGEVPEPELEPMDDGSIVIPVEGEPDFSALLESLDIDAEVVAPELPVEPEPAADFDAELLRDETPVQTGGVISTDAYLEDIGMEELGFSGGLTDELSALTGAERRQPARPQASVNAIPDNSGVLHRDARVDKSTVLKIIDGIKNL